MLKRCMLLIGVINLLFISLVYAEDYGSGEYGGGLYGIGEVVTASGEDVQTTTTTTSTTSFVSTPECSLSSDCEENEYCFENECYEGECFDDSVCNVGEGETCWDFRCVKLFDIEIIDFESPVKLGEFFNFIYFMKGMADVNGDVVINFWIEQEGNVVTSGSDVIYMGSFEEKTKTKKLFLPSNVESGNYNFIIKLTFEAYAVSTHRTIEIILDKEGLVTIEEIPLEAVVNDSLLPAKLFDISLLLDDSVVVSSDELSAVVVFESFGFEPTPVNLSFVIFDENDVELFRKSSSLVVLTENIVRESFKGLDLAEGKYYLVLYTLYNTDVVDEFRQDFEVVFEGKGFGLITGFFSVLSEGISINGWVLFVIVLILVLVVWNFKNKKKRTEIERKEIKKILYKKKIKERITDYKKEIRGAVKDYRKKAEKNKEIKNKKRESIAVEKFYDDLKKE